MKEIILRALKIKPATWDAETAGRFGAEASMEKTWIKALVDAGHHLTIRSPGTSDGDGHYLIPDAWVVCYGWDIESRAETLIEALADAIVDTFGKDEK